MQNPHATKDKGLTQQISHDRAHFEQYLQFVNTTLKYTVDTLL